MNNQQFVLRKAERKRTKLRIGMFGPTGCGKTYSALLLARGMTSGWDKIALIDTENGRGELYSELGDYQYLKLESPFSPERFIQAIKACENAGAEVIIIDSTSHEWEGQGGCLQINEALAQSKFKGNTWAAWSETTPRHQRFIEAIISSPCHIISTARSKMDTIQTEDKKIKKVGLKEIQREGFEYELTISFEIDRNSHMAVSGKDNTHLFDGRDPFMITEEDGQKIIEWNNGGIVDVVGQKKEIMRQLKRIGMPADDATQIQADILDLTGLGLKQENFAGIIDKLKMTKPIDDQIAEQQVDLLADIDEESTEKEAQDGPGDEKAPTKGKTTQSQAKNHPEPKKELSPAAKKMLEAKEKAAKKKVESLKPLMDPDVAKAYNTIVAKAEKDEETTEEELSFILDCDMGEFKGKEAYKTIFK